MTKKSILLGVTFSLLLAMSLSVFATNYTVSTIHVPVKNVDSVHWMTPAFVMCAVPINGFSNITTVGQLVEVNHQMVCTPFGRHGQCETVKVNGKLVCKNTLKRT